VIGGGWAGLTAAITLLDHGMPVKLLEAARQPGGRARTVRSSDMLIDNGQHLLIGAYQSTLSVMARVGIDLEQAFDRSPLSLQMFNGKLSGLHLKAPRLLPSPWHLLAAFITAKGLSVTERFSALRFGHRVLSNTVNTRPDFSVQALLHSEGQSPGLIRKLWEPLCLATLNTVPGIASAQLFTVVLQKAFGSLNRHSDLLIPARELSDLFPRAAVDYLEQHGGQVELGQRVTGLVTRDSRVCGVRTGSRQTDASQVVLATQHIMARRLISHHAPLAGLGQQLGELHDEPVTTLYLQYPETTRLPMPVVGMVGALSQWVFDRAHCGQAGLMGVVISSSGGHMKLAAADLTKQVASELATSFPHWPAPLKTRLLREKRATFSSRVGVETLRPSNRTPVRGLWLAGDYTDTGLPATLESAVVSGLCCAHEMLDHWHPGLPADDARRHDRGKLY